jgi:hypothetical protein
LCWRSAAHWRLAIVQLNTVHEIHFIHHANIVEFFFFSSTSFAQTHAGAELVFETIVDYDIFVGAAHAKRKQPSRTKGKATSSAR